VCRSFLHRCFYSQDGEVELWHLECWKDPTWFLGSKLVQHWHRAHFPSPPVELCAQESCSVELQVCGASGERGRRCPHSR
jgi:hypothetical protein